MDKETLDIPWHMFVMVRGETSEAMRDGGESRMHGCVGVRVFVPESRNVAYGRKGLQKT